MKVKDILREAPIPSDWDDSTYKPQVSFAQRIRYAKERAQQIGAGSSRVAFVIDYQGRKTVLKIAKNKKGIAQNDYESQMFSDYYVDGLNISIPMIDYDEKNESPTWVHVEYAEKMKPNMFKELFSGVSHNEIDDVISYLTGQRRVSPELEERYQQLQEDNEAIDSLVDLVGNYGLPMGDFTRLANWGVYKKRPVIIDLGLSSDVQQKYYT